MTVVVARMEILEITKLHKGDDYFTEVVKVKEFVELEEKNIVSRKSSNRRVYQIRKCDWHSRM